MGVLGHAPPELFENLDTVMAISELFEQFLRQKCYFFPPIRFVRTFSIYACLRLIFIKETENYGKIVSIKNMAETG